MSTYGPTGKHDASYIPPEGTWSSSQPNENLTMACGASVYGAARTEWEPRRIINPIKADRARKARASEGFDSTEYESIQAVTDRWQFLPWKGCISTSGDLIWIEEFTETGHWEPLSAQPAIADHEPTVDTLANAVEVPRVKAWLVEAATRNEERRRLKVVSIKEINSIYQAFLADPVSEAGNMEVALYLFAQIHFQECENLLRRAETALEVDDILSGFVVYLIERLRKLVAYLHKEAPDDPEVPRAKYDTTKHTFHHWINKKWAFYFSEVKTKFVRERKMTVAVNENEFASDEAESEDRIPGELYRVDVEREAMQRRDRGWNTPAEQVRRMLDDLNKPATFWGQLSESAKKMIRSMAKGQTQAQAATSAGITVVEGCRVVRTLREKATSDPEIENSLSRFGVSEAESDSEDEGNVVSIQASGDEPFEALLGVPEAAKLLCVHPKTIQAMARAGTIPCTRIGKYWRFRASALDVWVREAIESSDQSRRVA